MGPQYILSHFSNLNIIGPVRHHYDQIAFGLTSSYLRYVDV